MGINQDNKTKVYLRKEQQWEEVAENIMGDSVRLISINKSGKFLYTLDNKNQDITGLFKLNYANGKTENHPFKFSNSKIHLSLIANF